MDIKKVCRMNRPRHGSDSGANRNKTPAPAPAPKKEPVLTVADLTKQIKQLKHKLDRHSISISKVAEM